MTNSIMRREKGFTILEVVFAVSILAIGIMGYTVLKVSSRHSLFYAKNLNQAIRLTGAQLEGLMLSGYHSTEMDGVTNGGVHTFLPSDYDLTDPAQYEAYAKYFISGDFNADRVSWTVREQCPSQLTKLISYRTDWGSKNLVINEVQVRP